MSGDKDAGSKFPEVIDNSGQKAQWKMLMTEITQKHQEKVETKKLDKKMRIEAENVAMDTINSLVIEVIRRVRYKKKEEEAIEKECGRMLKELIRQVEKQGKEEVKIQRVQKKREKIEEKEKQRMEIESNISLTVTTRSGRITKKSQRLED